MTSFKTETTAISYPPRLWPHPFSLSNYWAVLSWSTFRPEVLNSIVYSIGAAMLSILVTAPAGYAASRYQFAGKRIAQFLVLATAMIPGVSLLVPTYFLLNRLGLLNNLVALIVIFTARIAPQTLWFIQSFVHSVPIEVEEAALVDGATRLGVMRTVVLPLVTPGLVAVFILGLTTVWNDYVVVAALAPNTERWTLQVGLVNQIFNSVGISWSFLMAFTFVSALPVLLIFLITQRWFVTGLTAGSLKG
jgi:multiple sugar transport system permease protein